MKKTSIKKFYILILAALLLPKLRVNAEETYTIKDYSAVMEVMQDTNIRTEPSVNGEKIGAYPAGTEIEVTGVCNETGWYRIEYEGATRYLSNLYLNQISVNYTFTTMAGRKYVSSETNLRTEPRVEGEKVGVLPVGEEFRITGRCNETGWYRVLYDGEIYYASDKYVMDFMVVSNVDKLYINSPVDIRRYPGDYTEILGHFNIGDTVDAKGITEDKEHYQIEQNGITGFIPAYTVEVLKRPSAYTYTNVSPSVKENAKAEYASNDSTAKEALIACVVILGCIAFVATLLKFGSTSSGSVSSSGHSKSKNDYSVFGIDWDGDGDTSIADDFLTMEMLEDDF